MTPTRRPTSQTASALISQRIESLGDWRGTILAQVRQLIHDAVPAIQEEWKWRGTPVWSSHGIVCAGETYKEKVKLTFARGGSLEDPKRLFNSSLSGNTRRAIDICAGDAINKAAFIRLVRRAAAANAAAHAARAARKPR